MSLVFYVLFRVLSHGVGEVVRNETHDIDSGVTEAVINIEVADVVLGLI